MCKGTCCEIDPQNLQCGIDKKNPYLSFEPYISNPWQNCVLNKTKQIFKITLKTNYRFLMPFLISLSRVLKFSWLKFFTSIVRFILRSVNSFDVIINKNVSIILMCWCCIERLLNLLGQSWLLILLIVSRSFLIAFWGSFKYNIT